MSVRLLLVLIATILNLGNAGNYLRAVRHGVRPHALSWVGFCALSVVSLGTSVVGHGGLGAVVGGASAVLCTAVISAVAFRVGSRSFDATDRVVLGAALLGAVLWPLTSSADLAAVVVSAAILIAFLPSVRKSWVRPGEEQALQFFLAAVMFVFRILSLDHINVATALFAVVSLLANLAYTVMLLVRRGQVVATAPAADEGKLPFSLTEVIPHMDGESAAWAQQMLEAQAAIPPDEYDLIVGGLF